MAYPRQRPRIAGGVRYCPRLRGYFRREPDAFGWGLGARQATDLGFGAWAVGLCWRLLRACPVAPRRFPRPAADGSHL